MRSWFRFRVLQVGCMQSAVRAVRSKVVLVRLRQEHDRVPLGWCATAAPLVDGRCRLCGGGVWHQ